MKINKTTCQHLLLLSWKTQIPEIFQCYITFRINTDAYTLASNQLRHKVYNDSKLKNKTCFSKLLFARGVQNTFLLCVLLSNGSLYAFLVFVCLEPFSWSDALSALLEASDGHDLEQLNHLSQLQAKYLWKSQWVASNGVLIGMCGLCVCLWS